MIWRQAEVGGGQLIALDFAVIEFGDHGRRMQRDFVHAAAVYHGGTLITEYAQGFCNRQHQFRAVDANQRQRRVRRIDKRPQHVKQGARFQLLADRHRVAETGVVFRREQEADAQFIQRGARFIGIHIQVDAKRGQQIGRARFTGDAAVTVFRHL